jgi:hypothetical protein
MDTDAWHYLKATTATRQPRRHIFLDTETRTQRQGKVYVQTWRCGVAIFRDAPKKGKLRESSVAYTDRGTLWDDIDTFVRPKSRVVLWTHNLGFDVRAAACFVELPLRGWQLVGWNIIPQGTWLVWTHADRTLTMVDSASVFPTTVAQLAKHFQTTKLPLPSNVDNMDQWLARCARDTQILRDAIVAYLDWLDREQLGTWQLTGTGQAFQAFRTRFMTHKMLVHWDEDARAMERAAMWAGRTEAYWHGTKHHTRIDEWDLSAAYPRIAQRSHVPVELVRALKNDNDFQRWMGEDGYAVVAEVEITTQVPLVPAEHNSRILWPVGTFVTTLWKPELDLARDCGAQVRFVRGFVYRTEPALQVWARWVLSIVDGTGEDHPAWLRIIAQHWSRAVIGRFAMQYQGWELLGETRRPAVKWWTQLDADTGEASELVQVGWHLWQSTGAEDWAHGMPAITGFITSQCRAIMTRLLLALPDRTALYMDTDSMLIEAGHDMSRAVELAQRVGQVLRVKKSWDRVTIYGPRQIVTGNRVRVSGVSSKAVPMPDGTLEGEVYQSLRGALRQGHTASVRVTPRRWKLRAVDARRVVGNDGWTRPVRLPTDVG